MSPEAIGLIGVIIIGLLIGFFVIGIQMNKKRLNTAFEAAQKESARLLEEARRESDRIVKNSIKEAKEEQQNRRRKLENENKLKQNEISKLETKIKSREGALEKKHSILEKKERELEKLEEQLEIDEQKYRGLIKQAEQTILDTRKVLETTAGMSAEEAKKHLFKIMEESARSEIKEKVRKIEDEMKREAELKAQSIVSMAVQRVASEYVNDSTVSVITLPGEDMKGRIIGREGRNIRAIEQATGVDLIIDDTPEAVIISCFNPIRREIAKLSLEKLIVDGRIHPARIEETVQRVTEEFDNTIREYGEQAALDLGITDLSPDIIYHLGKLRFKTAGQQSVLQHSVETARICGIIANELGMNAKKAKRAGLLHDIGKALDQDAEGHHSDIGANFCDKAGEDSAIVQSIRNHHREDQANIDPLSAVVCSANALSEQRPGARKEALESYIKRLGDMENIVNQFDKIDKVYVMQAGKEIRAIVTSMGVNDEEVVDLANDIASQLRKEMSFPGQVRVSVTRENKFMEYAK